MRKKSNYNLSYNHLTTMDMGELVPIGLQEVVQGDVFRMSTSALVRLAPMVAPVMHPTHVTIHHWFVPHRLVWDDFEDFITGGPAGTSAPSFPTITLPNSGAGGVIEGSLANYLGVPLGYNNDTTGYTVSALPFRAYAKIWNENYRDEDLQSELPISYFSGGDITTSTTLQHACWEKDYFTSARPFPQKGPEVTLPLGTTAPVVSSGDAVQFRVHPAGGTDHSFGTNGSNEFVMAGAPGAQTTYKFGTNTGLETDLTDATAASITDFRFAAAVQRFMENSSRYGSRFVEYLRRHGIKSSDARLQRPEYLGGGKETIQISEVLATSDDADKGVGSLYGHGIAAARSNKFIRFFEEPGYIVSLAYINPKTIYMNGLARHWNRRTKLDFWQPELEFIGQQAIPYKEIYAKSATPGHTWGWQDRYDELRRSESRISGMFAESELDMWHFGRQFENEPVLNASFVTAVPPIIPFADQDQDTCYLMVRHNISAKRLVSRSAAPKIV